MSSAPVSNLSREKLQQLLATIGSAPAEDAAQTEAAEYNWNQPHCFSRHQLNKLEDFAKEASKVIAQRFTALCHNDFDVAIASTDQHFASEILEQAGTSEDDDYYLAFGIDQTHPCGFVSIPYQTAFVWATQLLGDAETKEESKRELSRLEESLLLDIGSAIIEAFSDSSGYCKFQPVGSITKKALSFELQSAEELYKISFNVKKSGSESGHEAHILIICDALEPIVGKRTYIVDEFSPEDISKAVIACLQEMPISVAARLASTAITFEQIAGLEPCDILLFDKRIDEPAELIVEGVELFRGRPARSAGRYAVVITESCGTP